MKLCLSNNNILKNRISISGCILLIATGLSTITMLSSCQSGKQHKPTYPTLTVENSATKLALLTARSVKPQPADPKLQADWANFQVYI
ncbi:MAG: hypothetical protein KAH23_09650, partial [Kiritimatiellae bacterium]|nr:hypothetical protein [Kiritimatiellia bacterium]